VGVDLLWQVELGVCEVEVLPAPGAVGETVERHFAEDGLERAYMSGLDYTMSLASSVAYLISTRLAGGTQVEVVLVELAEQSPAVYVEASLQLGVGERRRLVAAEEAYDSPVERVGRREGPRRFAPGRGVRLFTSSSRPVSPSSSSRARASR